MWIRRALLVLLLVASIASPVLATIDVRSDGSDGVLNVTSADLTIDLSQAVTGDWTQTGNGKGVYDPVRWAVVFKYSSINIASGRTVRFTNHPSGAPVVWLVQGRATISGNVILDGEGANTTVNRETVPGPGGFPGGRGTYADSPGTGGHGPGGGASSAANQNVTINAAAHATSPSGSSGAIYGSVRILPLVGGSGGAGHGLVSASGGAGGGALLLAVGQTLVLNGGIYARGGSYINVNANSTSYQSGEGSGGAVRVVADTLTGSGTAVATGMNGVGGLGRIRIETNSLGLTTQTSPAYSLLSPLGVDGVVLWPPAPEPTIRIATVNGQTVTSDPRLNPAALVGGDLTISNTTFVPITLEATNVPTNATVTVRVVLGRGSVYTSPPATLVSGNATSSTWAVTLTALSPARVSSLQARVILP